MRCMQQTRSPHPQAAAFIDRDGVINRDLHHVHRIEDWQWLPGAFEGLRVLQGAGYRLVVVTNQAGIGRGLYTEGQFQALTAYMRQGLQEQGITLAGVYHCPHHPQAGLGVYRQACACRKPAPGMLVQAAAELSLDLAQSVLVGDKHSDIQAGRRAGLRACVLVRSGHALSEADEAGADACLADLREAAAWLLALSA